MTDPLLDLIIRYKHVKNIPVKELDKLGYAKLEIRRDSEITYRLVKTEQLEKEKVLVEKVAPFGKLEFLIKRNHSFTSLRGDVLKRAKKLYSHLDDVLRGYDTPIELAQIFPADSSISFFSNKFADYLCDKFRMVEFNYIIADQMHFVYKSDEVLQHEINRFASLNESNPNMRVYQNLELLLDENINDPSLSSEQAERVFVDLERVRSSELDSIEVKKLFLEELKSKPYDAWELELEDFEELNEKFLSKEFKEFLLNSKTTWDDTYRVYVTQFLESEGYERIASGLHQCENTNDCLEYLTNQKIDSLPSYQEQKELKKMLGEAETTNEKIGLSGKLKEAKVKIKEERRMLDGAVEFLFPYRAYMKHCNGLIKKIQKLLVVSEDKNYQSYFIDGTPNPEYDKDPGKVSGDCTARTPLPFYDPRVHNVKVFNPDNEYIGNIYLLEAKSVDQKVWHLEAIQIPQKADWDEFTSSLIDVLSSAAKEQQVNLITANYDSHLISNYDYIGEAVIRFNESNNLGRVDVKIPEIFIRDGYSNFQGTGHGARVLAVPMP